MDFDIRTAKSSTINQEIFMWKLFMWYIFNADLFSWVYGTHENILT